VNVYEHSLTHFMTALHKDLKEQLFFHQTRAFATTLDAIDPPVYAL